MNRVALIGRLARDVEIRTTQSGKSVATFALAVDTGFGDNKHADFIPIVVWGKTVEACGRCLHKGSKAAVNGRISTRSYDANDGTKHYVTEVIADAYYGVEFLDGKKNNDQDNGFGFGQEVGEQDIPL